MKFIITEEMNKKCSEFAKNSVNTSSRKYASRNQFDIDKITKDIRNGKIAEEGVWHLLVDKFPHLSKPDHTIYAAKDKSWDPDLKDISSNMRFAVKSQDIESAINFGESWVFQYGEGKKYDCDTGIFGNNLDSNHFVCFVSLNYPKKTGIIKAIVKVKWLHDNKMFKPMRKANLNGNKLAVYYEDLSKHPEELWQV